MKAETMFKEYKQMKKELSILKFQLSQFQGIDCEELISAMCFSRPVGEESLPSGSISDKTAKIALNYRKIAEHENEEWLNFLKKRYKDICEEIHFFEHSIMELEGILPEVVMDLVKGDLTWDSMMKKYNVSHAMIGKYRKTAIKELNDRYILRDKQIETYILS